MIVGYDLKKLEKRILDKTQKTSSCWVWRGYVEKDGYGRMTVNNKPYFTHRLSYFLFKGKLNNNLVLDHTCRNRSCLNPDHLNQVSQRENCHNNSESSSYYNKLKTHCPKGHEYTVENTISKKNAYGISRLCRQCSRDYANSKYIKRKAGL